MEDTIRNGMHDLNLASRKAEEAAWRRFEATQWLGSLVGPLGISTQPSEREFISCLGNGLVLCNAINKIQPGSIPKVVESNAPSQFLTWDSQPLPAYQYFENVRNFLVAVEELKLPTFEASDLERDNLEVGSSVKVVDCILALRGYHEWKQLSGGNGFFKPPRSPLVMHSANRVHSRASEAISSNPCRQLDMSKACNDIPLTESGTQKLEDLIAKAIVECMIDGKENIDNNLIASFRNGNLLKLIFKDLLGGGRSLAHPISPPTLEPLENLSIRNHKCGSTRDQGINYLALSDLFRLSNRRKDIMKYDIHVQMVEIYNEQLHFCHLAHKFSASRLEIRSCTSENGLSIPDASVHYVESTNDVLSLVKRGDLNRVVSSTAINNQSSRSHSVLTVHVHGKDVSGSILRSCLHLVDLAGSERVEKSEVSGDGLREAQYINKSLSCLGDVISALAQKSSHIPYRNSKLTLLLQNALGGHAKTLMFAHVSPEADSFGETISTLKFAQRVSTVELGVSHMNKESSEVIELKQQIESLKEALANKEARTIQPTKPKEPRSPLEKPPHAMTEHSPRSKQSILLTKGPKSPSMPTRSRRLSLEGPRPVPKDPVQIKLSETVSNLLPSKQCWYSNTPNFKILKQPQSHMDIAVYKSRVAKTDCGTQIPTLQPKTPEPPTLVRNEVHIMMHGDFSTEPRTPGLTSNANGKGSHIRKSLRTIGKLINGSEKRNQQKKVEASPVNGMHKIHGARSPVSSNARAMRRQSLTGVVQTSDRRSSLGGKSTYSCTNETRNSKTPPPVHISAKATNRGVLMVRVLLNWFLNIKSTGSQWEEKEEEEEAVGCNGGLLELWQRGGEEEESGKTKEGNDSGGTTGDEGSGE
ncbi:Kinesin-like protein KIN-14L [Camellia lanceoleosa]|uniref:Kinesin-like protein KIN-14L n=1 Tax=Camellia lanceoleosa TaxID=1840588 RepID=A0ACC0G9M4_9ERIC|nr:Kinesin-like protein KIN-14L [Camellia lanceoleosa]